jgi:hypothetical protein
MQRQTRLTKWCFIISICEGLFYRLQFIVGQIFSIYAIDDHKQLYVLKQAVIAPERMVLAAIDLVEGFFDFDVRTFEFYLYQGNPLTKSVTSYILVASFQTDLISNLK